MKILLNLLTIAVVLCLLHSSGPGTLLGQDKQDKEKQASSNKGKIEGTKWSSLEGKVKDNLLPAGVLKLEFSKDFKLVYDVAGKKLSGTYELGEGDKVIMSFDEELAGRKKHVERIVIKGKSLTLIDLDGTSVKFERVLK